MSRRIVSPFSSSTFSRSLSYKGQIQKADPRYIVKLAHAIYESHEACPNGCTSRSSINSYKFTPYDCEIGVTESTYVGNRSAIPVIAWARSLPAFEIREK